MENEEKTEKIIQKRTQQNKGNNYKRKAKFKSKESKKGESRNKTINGKQQVKQTNNGRNV